MSAPAPTKADRDDHFTRAMAKAGIEPETPLRAVLWTVWEAAETAHACATDKARGITPAGERELIDRVTEACEMATERRAMRLTRGLAWRNFALGVAAGAVAFELGYLAGSGVLW